jgi:hypothetical protein
LQRGRALGAGEPWNERKPVKRWVVVVVVIALLAVPVILAFKLPTTNLA